MNRKRVIKLQCPFERIKKYNNHPETSLYKAVIMQMIIDASNISNDPQSIKDEIEGKAWLFGGNADFQLICNMAGITSTTVVDFAYHLIERHHKKEGKKSYYSRKKPQKTKIFLSI